MARDLRDLLPDYSTVVDIKTCAGSNSWSVAVGSTHVTVPCTGRWWESEVRTGRIHEAQWFTGSSELVTEDKPSRTPGSPFWLSREEYILYGCDALSEVLWWQQHISNESRKLRKSVCVRQQRSCEVCCNVALTESEAVGSFRPYHSNSPVTLPLGVHIRTFQSWRALLACSFLTQEGELKEKYN
jgi:hypothetical protein